MYKDLAKYWIGFVPVASLAGLGVAFGPTARQLSQVGLSTWIGMRWPGGLALVLALVALTAVTVWPRPSRSRTA